MGEARRAEAVLDASALLAWLVQERGADVVAEYLPQAVISAVNLSEVLYRGQRLGRNVTTLPARLGHPGLRVEPFTVDDALLATVIYARDGRHLLSLADRCCLATAIRLKLPASPATAPGRAWTWGSRCWPSARRRWPGGGGRLGGRWRPGRGGRRRSGCRRPRPRA